MQPRRQHLSPAVDVTCTQGGAGVSLSTPGPRVGHSCWSFLLKLTSRAPIAECCSPTLTLSSYLPALTLNNFRWLPKWNPHTEPGVCDRGGMSLSSVPVLSSRAELLSSSVRQHLSGSLPSRGLYFPGCTLWGRNSCLLISEVTAQGRSVPNTEPQSQVSAQGPLYHCQTCHRSHSHTCALEH